MTTFSSIMLVAGREVRTRLLSKATIISTLIILIVLIGGMVALSIFTDRQGATPTQVGISEQTHDLAPALEQVASQQGFNLELRQLDYDEAVTQLEEGDLDAYLSGEPQSPLVSFDGMPDGALMGVVNAATQQYALTGVISGLGGDPQQVQSELAGAVPRTESVGEETEFDPYKMIAAGATISLLLFALMQGTQLLAMGVVEEKASRVVEILLATIRPSQLMAGKVIGIGFITLVQIALFAAAAALSAQLLGLLDGVEINVGDFLAWLLIWFFLGFGLYAVVTAGIAALVSRQEDIGSVTTPIILLIMVPFYLGIWLVPSNPDSTLVKALSQVPIFAPFMMPARQAFTDVPVSELAIAIGGSLVLIPILVWIGGRIYSRAVLSTGGRMKLSEALKG